MPQINHATREIACKIVYYGPGRSGKTTNLRHLHEHLPAERRGEIVSLATAGDRTLFFDFLPVDLGRIAGYRVRLQLYTVPGQVYYDSVRKLVLRGADGVVFVADSRPDRAEDNLASLHNLHEHLGAHGLDGSIIPVCLQYNKRDLPEALGTPEMDRALNVDRLPRFEACATRGEGVFETLRCISERVLESVSAGLGAGTRSRA